MCCAVLPVLQCRVSFFLFLSPQNRHTPSSPQVEEASVLSAHAYTASQHSWLSSPHQPGTLHHAGEGEGALAPGAPTKEEFLQYGVENGGDRSTLEQGFTSCRRGSVKDITYKVCPQEDQGSVDSASLPVLVLCNQSASSLAFLCLLLQGFGCY